MTKWSEREIRLLTETLASRGWELNRATLAAFGRNVGRSFYSVREQARVLKATHQSSITTGGIVNPTPILDCDGFPVRPSPPAPDIGTPMPEPAPCVPTVTLPSFEGDRGSVTNEEHWHNRYRDLEKEYEKALKEVDAVDRLCRMVADRQPVSYAPAPPVPPPTDPGEGRAQSAVLLFSDTHVGQVIRPDQTLGFGLYDVDVFLDRLARLDSTVDGIIRNHTTTPIDRIHIAVMGDMLHGALSHSAEADQQVTLFDQFFTAGHAIAQFVRNVARLGEVVLHCTVGNHCVDTETEILTRRGWLRFDQVTTDDECLGLLPDGKTAVWQRVQDVVVEPQIDRTVKIENREFFFSGTEHHRFYFRMNRSPKLFEGRWSEIENLRVDGMQIPAAGMYEQPGLDRVSPYLELVAAVLTDGSVLPDGRIFLYQKPSKRDWMLEALQKSGLEYTESFRTRKAPEAICGRLWQGGPTTEEWSARLTADSSRLLMERAPFKKGEIPAWAWELNHAQFDRFLGALLDGDGTHRSPRNPNSSVLYGKSEEFLSQVQALCALHGIRATLCSYQPNNTNPNTQWRLLITKDPNRALGNKSRIEYSEPRPGAKVWCVRTETENWFCRRSGISYFTGNTRWGTQKKMPTAQRYSNLDQFLYVYVQALTREIPNVKWVIDRQPYAIWECQGFTMHQSHGDHLRGGDRALGIPNHSVGRMVSTTTQMFDKAAMPAPDYYLVGHMHRKIELPTARGDVIINGGFPGLDGYALMSNFNPVDPTQKLFFVHPQFGRTASYDVALKFAEPGSGRKRYEIPA